MTPDEIEVARREFLDECEMVVKVPCAWIFETTRRPGPYTHSSHFFPIPLYTYVGLRRSADESRVRTKTAVLHPTKVQPDSDHIGRVMLTASSWSGGVQHPD